MARELNKLELKFKEDTEKEFPDYYDYTPYVVGFLKEDTRNAFAGYVLALRIYGGPWLEEIQSSTTSE